MPLTTTDDGTRIIIMHHRDKIRSLAFHPDKKHIWSGGTEGTIREWVVEDGQEVGDPMVTSSYINAIGISKDGKWIVSGDAYGIVIIWDAKTHKKVAEAVGHSTGVVVIDISPLSRTFATGSEDRSVIVWDIETGQKLVGRLEHEFPVYGVKFSPSGDRIATAQSVPSPIHILDSRTGELLLKTQANVGARHSANIIWSHGDQLIILNNSRYNNAILVFDAWTGSLLSEWTVQDHPPIPLPKLAGNEDAQFVVSYTTGCISFWDVSTRNQIASVSEQASDYWTMVLSPDGRYLASGGEDKKITIRRLRDIIPPSYEAGHGNTHLQNLVVAAGSHSCDREKTLVQTNLYDHRLPLIHISGVALKSWIRGDLTGAEAILTEEIIHGSKDNHHKLANRALIRVRFRDWLAAIRDGEESILTQPSALGYIATAVARIGNGEHEAGVREFDLASQYCDPQDCSLLLLIKYAALCGGEKYDERILLHMNDLITKMDDEATLLSVLSVLYVQRGEVYFKQGDYEHAIQSFERAQALARPHASAHLVVISLIFGWKFNGVGIIARQRLCEVLYSADRTREAVESLLQMVDAFGWEVQTADDITNWITDFSKRCAARFEAIGDSALKSGDCNEAVEQYSVAISLKPPTAHGLHLKRSKAQLQKLSWEDALKDANKAIALDTSSPQGYEQKHAALHGMGRHADAIDAYKTMLLKLEQSPDPLIRQQRLEYVEPSETEVEIRKAIGQAIRDTPRVLIHTRNGRLHDKAMQMSALEALPFFKKLISATTKHLDPTSIAKEVNKHCRYAMLSHRWEQNEPLFQTVEHRSIYELEKSPTNDKLRNFCSLMRNAGFYWAWSDTVCIDKSNHVVLQESLVAMFSWYRGSSLTAVYLRDVGELSGPGSLQDSVWNTRAWTFQEYVASEVVQFYTQEWTPYLNLTTTNHKSASEVITEMERATGVSAHDLLALHPGSDSIRQKLCLASMRQTTLTEDIAYSLLGILGVKSMSVIYGEGKQALGRLLGIVLTDSGDTSILAWKGDPGSYNSALPDDITVFRQLATTHLPHPLTDAEMESTVSRLHATSLNTELEIALYDRLNVLSPPWFVAKRLKLPCIMFPLGTLATPRSRDPANPIRVYRARSASLGIVEIKTKEDLSHLASLILVHPWVDALIDRELPGLAMDDSELPPLFPDDENVSLDNAREQSVASPTFAPPREMPMDKQTRALRLVARLRQPFGGLLLASLRDGGVEYKRVATDSLVMVQVREDADLALVLKNVYTLDVL